MPIFPYNLNTTPTRQNSGGILTPRDAFVDTVRQGFLTPTGLSLTGTMGTMPWPGSTENVAVAFAGGNRVYKLVGDPDLTFSYLPNRDTYDDLDYNGNIYHRDVAIGAAAPAYTSFTELRLQRVRTGPSTITEVQQLALVIPTVGTVAPFVSFPQLIVSGGTVVFLHGLNQTPTEYRYKLRCVTPEFGYIAGDELFDICLFGKNAQEVAVSLIADAMTIYLTYSTQTPVFHALTKVGGAGVNLTSLNWRFIVQARVS